ncbi:hypothetical protein DAEQUDRAFT_386976 [Daedalea quercina L-15889]|uniref:DUF6533 domain-containing protein n=1 Tax=Daedalea quercina L-15889 TaxID=1314783 RepID=A0A165NXG3_9APHY|nr:hypothetical protein DAEQUDRAFT_386976 [Daedalea quercina L-15889]
MSLVIGDIRATFAFLVCSKAIYSYDRCITLSREVGLIWQGRRMSVANVLYILLHVSVAAYQYIDVAEVMTTDCNVSGYISQVVQGCAAALFHISNGGFMALRAHTINNGSMWLAAVIFLLSLVNAAFIIYQICTLDPVTVPPPIGCVMLSNVSARALQTMVIVEQACTLLVVSIWRHASRVNIINHVRVDTSTPLETTTILLRDGIMYSVTILALLIANTTLSLAYISIAIVLSDMSY